MLINNSSIEISQIPYVCITMQLNLLMGLFLQVIFEPVQISEFI